MDRIAEWMMKTYRIGTCLLFILLWLSSCKTSDNQLPKSLVIMPLGPVKKEVKDSIAAIIQQMYGYKVKILPNQDLPSKAYIQIKVPRYRADSLLRYLHSKLDDSADIILGITEADISTTKRGNDGKVLIPENRYRDWGVMGLGTLPGQCCIVSTFRFKNSDNTKFYDRLKKICIHEIGHNLGLNHCSDLNCVMRDAAETIHTIDFVRMGFCNACLKKLKSKP